MHWTRTQNINSGPPRCPCLPWIPGSPFQDDYLAPPWYHPDIMPMGSMTSYHVAIRPTPSNRCAATLNVWPSSLPPTVWSPPLQEECPQLCCCLGNNIGCFHCWPTGCQDPQQCGKTDRTICDYYLMSFHQKERPVKGKKERKKERKKKPTIAWNMALSFLHSTFGRGRITKKKPKKKKERKKKWVTQGNSHNGKIK